MMLFKICLPGDFWMEEFMLEMHSWIFPQNLLFLGNNVFVGNHPNQCFSIHFNQSALTEMFVWTVGRYSAFIKQNNAILHNTLPKKSQRWIFHLSTSLCK